MGYDVDDKVFWCEISCLKEEKYGMEVKTIVARSFNDLWLITKTEMLDILLRGGFTVEEEKIFQEKLFLHEARASFAANGKRAQVAYGDVLESAADYEAHYKRLTDHLAHCE